MKNLSIIFTLIIALSFIGCGNIQGNQVDDNQPISNNTNEAEVQVVHLTMESFKEKVWDFEKNPTEWVYKGDVPCIIDFYADWCKPCKMIAPIMEDLANEYEGKIIIYKVDTQKERELAGAFGIKSIPSVLFSPLEGRPEMRQGALPKTEYVKIIDNFLLKK